MRQCWNRQTGTFEGRVSLTYGFKSRLPHQVRGFAKAKPLSFFAFRVLFRGRFWIRFYAEPSKNWIVQQIFTGIAGEYYFAFLNPNLCPILRWVCCKPYGRLLFPCRAGSHEHQQFCVSLWLEHEFEHRKSFEHGMNTTWARILYKQKRSSPQGCSAFIVYAPGYSPSCRFSFIFWLIFFAWILM